MKKSKSKKRTRKRKERNNGGKETAALNFFFRILIIFNFIFEQKINKNDKKREIRGNNSIKNLITIYIYSEIDNNYRERKKSILIEF